MNFELTSLRSRTRYAPVEKAVDTIESVPGHEVPAPSRAREWIPSSLKLSRALPLAVFCWTFIAVLEVFNYLVTKREGLSTTNQHAVNLSRYLPTLAVIIFAFAFKIAVSDVKKVIPWANMSDRWTSAKDSALLDYVNKVEFLAIFLAFKRRHWVVAMSLAAGFLCGALVPLANSLTFVDLFAPRSFSTDLTKTTVFDFNEALQLPNGTLTIPWNYLGGRPYAAVTAERLPGGLPSPWTRKNYAFDQFSSNITDVNKNATIVANVSAISSALDCQSLRYSYSEHNPYNYTVPDTVITANSADLTAARCPISLSAYSPGTRNMIWTNITRCSNDFSDVRILATVLTNDTNTPMDQKAAGLICKPSFSTQTAQITVNSTDSRVLDYRILDEPHTMDIKTSTAALWIYMNNPLDSDLQNIFGRVFRGPTRGGPFNAEARPVAIYNNVTYAVYLFASAGLYSASLEQDLFMKRLMDGDQDRFSLYLQNPDLFKAHVEELTTNIWTQFINSFARTDVSLPLEGRALVREARLFVRPVSLRAMQSLLLVIGVVIVLQCTMLRPRTVLRRDPGPIASTAMVVAASDSQYEKDFADVATVSQDITERRFASTKFMFKAASATEQPSLHMTRTHHIDDKDDIMHQPSNRPVEEVSAAITSMWRPLPLHLSIKIAHTVIICIAMLLLGLLQAFSSRSSGLANHSSAVATAYSIVPSILLVLLGYWCSGVDSAIRSLALYNDLRRCSGQKTLLLNIKDVPLFSLPFRNRTHRGALSLLCGSVVILMIPAVKLVAAGLYTTVLTQDSTSVQALVDSSLVDRFSENLSLDSSMVDSVVQQASEFTEWVNIASFQVPQRAGIIDNVVLSNLTEVDTDSAAIGNNGQINARLPGIAIDYDCQVIPNQDFNFSAYISLWQTTPLNSSEPVDRQDWYFQWFCGTQRCREVLNITDPTNYFQGFRYEPASTIPVPRYWGSAGVPTRFQREAGSIDVNFTMWLSDRSLFSKGEFRNMTQIATRLSNSTDGITRTWVDSATFDIPLPTMNAVVCSRNLSRVMVNATFARPLGRDDRGDQVPLPWQPVAIDRTTMVYERPYPRMQPAWLYPMGASRSQYTGGEELDGSMASDELRPSRGSPNNFFEQLAAHAVLLEKDLTSLLDPTKLGAIVTESLTSYCAQVITQLRPIAARSSVAGSLTPSTFVLNNPVPRISQHLPTTIVLEALLAVMLSCLLWIYIQFPSKSILPKAPDSIAARYSLLANSHLVRHLREERIVNVNDSYIWDKKAALGWWRSDGSNHDGQTRWRWGIDVEDSHLSEVQLTSWKNPPVMESFNHMNGSSEELIPDPRPRHNYQEDSITLDRQDSNVSDGHSQYTIATSHPPSLPEIQYLLQSDNFADMGNDQDDRPYNVHTRQSGIMADNRHVEEYVQKRDNTDIQW